MRDIRTAVGRVCMLGWEGECLISRKKWAYDRARRHDTLGARLYMGKNGLKRSEWASFVGDKRVRTNVPAFKDDFTVSFVEEMRQDILFPLSLPDIRF